MGRGKEGKIPDIFPSLPNYYEKEKIGVFPIFSLGKFLGKKSEFSRYFPSGRKPLLLYNKIFPPKGGGKNIIQE
jgi:hypothetical protein